MIDGIFLTKDKDLGFRRDRYYTVRPVQSHWGITISDRNNVIAVLDRTEVAIIAKFLNDFLADENNK